MTERLRGGRVYLDANVFIYTFEAHEPYVGPLRDLFAAADRRDVEVVTSEITLAETLVRPIREHAHAQIEVYTKHLTDGPVLRVMPVSREILVAAAHLRAAHRALRLPDAVHAATAQAAGCTALLTNDTRFAAVPGLEMVRLAEMARRG